MRKPGGDLKCPKCDERFSRPNGVTRHLRESHGVSAGSGKPCGACKRRDGTHSALCARGGKPKPAAASPKPKATPLAGNGAGDKTLPDDKVLRQSLMVARAEMEAQKLKLDAGIAALDVLLGRGNG